VSLKPKHQRLALAGAALVALLAAVMLAMWGLQDRAAYFATPSDIAKGGVQVDRAMRLGGMVEEGSLESLPDGITIRFTVVDGGDRVVTSYKGIPPSLFREGSGVVAEGKLQRDGTFIADNILAKHDERYMPPQMGNSDPEHAVEATITS
jgi:cytochrome c-type biogenesis protein CcmE